MKKRCAWSTEDPLYIAYHDDEWGTPIHDDRLLFEFLVLEGFQAGLSWLTILKKRDNFRKAFHNFDCETVANYTGKDITRLMADSGIIRNRLKIEAARKNARGVLKIQEEFGSLDSYLWGFVNGQPIQNGWKSMAELPAKTELSEKMSKDLKKRGFNFVGPTICYAFMQAIGMVNDHTTDCFRYEEIKKTRRMMDLDQLVEVAKESGAAAASVIQTSDIQFSEEFRTLCEQNSCGKYGTNWMCPPAIGTYEELKATVLTFSEGVVFQTIHSLADSFDYEGMVKAEEDHGETFKTILNHIQSTSGAEDVLALNVGVCNVCKQCTYPDGQECRFPDKAVASIEAHCIDVNALVTSCNIPYINGPNTVSYVGLFLF